MIGVLRGAGLVLLLALLSLPALAQEDDEDPVEPTTTTIAGSGLVTATLSQLADAGGIPLEAEILTTGTIEGMRSFCLGEAALVGTTAPISVQEETLCEQNGVTFEEYVLGYQALAVIVHPEIDFVDCAAPDELANLFAPSSQDTITDWAQLGYNTLTNIPLTVYLPPANTPIYAILDEIVNGFGLRRDVEIEADSSAILEAVATTPGAVGVVPFSALPDDDSVRVLDITNPDLGDCITPSIESLEDGQYPPTTELFVYTNAETTEFDDLLAFAFSDDAATALADASLTPPSTETLALNTGILIEEAEAGRQFSRDLVAFQIPPTLSGTLSLAGTPTAQGYLQNLVTLFSQSYQTVTIDTDFAGQAAGIRRFCSGEIDLLLTTRDFTETELEGCTNNDINPVSFELGQQIVVLVTNAAAEYPQCLTPQQVIALWRSDPTTMPETWQEVDDTLPETDLTLVAPPTGSTPLTDILLTPGGGAPLPIRLDVAETNRDPVYRAAAVTAVDGALTYMSWSDYQSIPEDQLESVRLVRIVDDCADAPAVEDAINDGTYPYLTDVRLTVDQRDLVRTEVQSMLWFIFQDANFQRYETSDLSGLEFGDFETTRFLVQDAFDEAAEAGFTPETIEPPLTSPGFGPGLPFDLLPSANTPPQIAPPPTNP